MYEQFLFLWLPAGLLVAALVVSIWLTVTAQMQNRRMGIHPWQYSLRTFLVAATLIALAGGLAAYALRK